ncbi:hypothetical protein POTOM_028466 [Populus tomentosa]|uniref:Uncharacterized protein n=1 Tax=Populus tomentosa TaxID=118781 RepID=A0A8X8CUV7_POPTO|nr:hypothetical protein POTOM_028466 [Populus tomentosa]
MCTLELLSNHKINSFMSTRKEELDLFIDYIKDASLERVAVDLSAKVSSLSADIKRRVSTAEACGGAGGGSVGGEGVEVGLRGILDSSEGRVGSRRGVSTLGVSEVVGLERVVSRQGTLDPKTLRKAAASFRIFSFNNARAFISSLSMVGLGLSRERDMLVGSKDTSATAIEWTLSELIKHPRVMKKVQKELEEKIGMDRMVEESDLEGLEYLHMVIKEAFRLHPVAPLLGPHESMEDCTIDGFLIPQKTRVLVNVWAIGRDQSAWTDANKFIPERFAGSNIDVRGRDFQLLPFGSGRRSCPGMHLGLTMVRQIVAQLVHCFDWELPNNMLPEELDMTESFGLVTPRANHLCATPTYRLHL